METIENWVSVGKWTNLFWFLAVPVPLAVFVFAAYEISDAVFFAWRAGGATGAADFLFSSNRATATHAIAYLVAIVGTWGWVTHLLPAALSFLFRFPFIRIDERGIRKGWFVRYPWKRIRELRMEKKEGWFFETYELLLDVGETEAVSIDFSAGTESPEEGFEIAKRWHALRGW